MSKLDNIQYKNRTESSLIKSGAGAVYGVVVNSHTSGTLQLDDATAVGSVAAVGTLTSSGAAAPADYATATLTGTGGTNFVDDVKATSTLTSTGAMVPGIHGSTTLTSDTTEVTEDEIVTLGAIVYRFRDVGNLAQAYDVLIDAADPDVTLGNLVKAINATGTAGTEYFAGTLVHPNFVAADVGTNATVITSRIVGDAAATATINALATTETTSHLTFTGAAITNGVTAVTTDAALLVIGTREYSVVTALSETTGADAVVDQILYGANEASMLDNLKLAINAGATAGTNYSTGTVVNADVVAGTNADTTQLITAIVTGAVGNAIATTEAMANTAWTSTVLTGGLDAETITIDTTVYTYKDTTAAAYDVKIGASEAVSLDNLKAAINASGVGDGTDYHTGTLVHPTVIATDNAATTQVIRARTIGTAANSIATTETGATAGWAAGTMGSGVATTNALITIDSTVYTAVVTMAENINLTAIPYQVLWVTSEAVFLDNLKSAINDTGTEGTDYATGTAEHPTVEATTNTNTAQTVQARSTGSAGNSIATTETVANYVWGATTLASGAGVTGRTIVSTFTFAAGSGIYEFPQGISFVNGLYTTIGGVIDYTILYD